MVNPFGYTPSDANAAIVEQNRAEAQAAADKKAPSWKKKVRDLISASKELASDAVDTAKDVGLQATSGIAELGSGVSYAAKDGALALDWDTAANIADSFGDSAKGYQDWVGKPKTALGSIVKELPGEALSVGGSALASLPHPLAKVAGGALAGIPAAAVYGNSVEAQREAGKDPNRWIPATVAAVDVLGGKTVDKVAKSIKLGFGSNKDVGKIQRRIDSLQRDLANDVLPVGIKSKEDLKKAIKRQQKNLLQFKTQDAVANNSLPLAGGSAALGASTAANNYIQDAENVSNIEGALSGLKDYFIK